LPFIEGTPGFAVSIALVSRDGLPLLGVVNDPVHQRMWSAVKGHGVVDGRGRPVPGVGIPVPASGTALKWYMDRSLKQDPRYGKMRHRLEQVAADQGLSGVDIIAHAGAVMNACMTMQSAPAVYFKCPRQGDSGGSIWDYAATAAIFSELLLPVGDAFGEPLALNRADSTFLNHRGVVYATSSFWASSIRTLIADMVHWS
jgi:3'-phosphoadenosine 5'-phosphosulfate (PAPS) 3'-phosphatase